jgi:hypothetical protein
MHAMSDGTVDQAASDARGLMEGFVAQEMHDAVSLFNEGSRSGAMWLFGFATHPLMDMTSPAHTYQSDSPLAGEPIPWCGLDPSSCSNLFQHGGDGDGHVWNPGTIEDLKHLNANPDIQGLNNLMLRMWFQVLTGRKLHCQ